MGDAHVNGGFKKLNNQNYNTWSMLMESYLQGHDLWEVVGCAEVNPLNDDVVLKKWKI